MFTILSYGGGRQTVALCVLIARGILSRPDRIVMADTGRENPMTWAYLAAHVRPLLEPLGLDVEIAPHSLATVDTHAHNGDLLLPVYTETGKLSGFCSNEWKARVVRRHLRATGVTSAEFWIGYAFDERRRWNKPPAADEAAWPRRFPLVEMMTTTGDCLAIVAAAGLPEPFISACWMCPNKRNAEWKHLRDHQPALFDAACDMDDEWRAEDIERGGSGVWLHKSRVPLREADLSEPETPEMARQCGLGMCFV